MRQRDARYGHVIETSEIERRHRDMCLATFLPGGREGGRTGGGGREGGRVGDLMQCPTIYIGSPNQYLYTHVHITEITCVCVCVRVCVCVCVCMSICIYVYMYICIYIYILMRREYNIFV